MVNNNGNTNKSLTGNSTNSNLGGFTDFTHDLTKQVIAEIVLLILSSILMFLFCFCLAVGN